MPLDQFKQCERVKAGSRNVHFARSLVPDRYGYRDRIAFRVANDGKLRMLGISTPKRSPMAPDLPAISETLPGYDVTGWYALFVPAKTPKEIIQKMYTGVKAAVDDPTWRKAVGQMARTRTPLSQRSARCSAPKRLDRLGAESLLQIGVDPIEELRRG